MASKKEPEIKNQVKQDLLDQLDRSGTIGRYYENLVDDYMSLWETKDELYKDIKKRGVKVTKVDSRGQEQIVNNESIEQALKTNNQMLKILDALGIQAVRAESTQGGVDDDL